MAKWLRSILLFAGFTLLLYHMTIAHHHDDDDDATEHAQHHPNDALEHVKIDHQFFQGHQQFFAIDLATVTLLPQVFQLHEPAAVELPKTTWLHPDEPHPPKRCCLQLILRGPPVSVNAAV